MLNWKRLNQVVSLVEKYKKINVISEIIIFNNNPEIYLNLKSDKVVSFNTTKNLGLFTRFYGASSASNPCILFVDDDVFFPEETIERLREEWLIMPNRCYGVAGRRVGNGQYNRIKAFGEVEIVLTKCSMTSKENCIDLLKDLPFFEYNPFNLTKGHGEDIVLSFKAMSKTKRLNEVLELSFDDFGEDAHALCNNKNHNKNRNYVLSKCREYFNISLE